jgi:hypothetical protein
MITKSDIKKHKRSYKTFNTDRLIAFLDKNKAWSDYFSVKEANDARCETERHQQNLSFGRMCLQWVDQFNWNGISQELKDEALDLYVFAKRKGICPETIAKHEDIDEWLFVAINQAAIYGETIQPRVKKEPTYKIPERTIEDALADELLYQSSAKTAYDKMDDDENVYRLINAQKKIRKQSKFITCLKAILRTQAKEWCTERNNIIKLEHPEFGRYYYYYKSNWGKKSGSYHKFRTNSFTDFWDKVNSLNQGIRA